ncbi:MAG: protein kinase [Gemmatimonadota bacterium]
MPTDLDIEFDEGFEERLTVALRDRYRIEKELGRGGMAVVFLAHDLKHDRPVALKVLRPEMAASIGTERFLREIQIAAKLNHQHILSVHDSGEAAGFLYYVMPFVVGESLRQRMHRVGPMPIEESLRIAREVASALSYAHSLEVVHRDIKPENILLHHDEAMVADFGIARALTAAGGARLTETGIAIGTPLYMSPEQAGGTEEVDGRSDIYALGCVVYEMLAGDPPFTGRNANVVIARHLADTPTALEVVRPGVPVHTARAVAKALNKVRADRFATATDFSDSLGAAERGGMPAGPSSDRRRRYARWAVSALATLAVAVVVALVAFPLFTGGSLSVTVGAIVPVTNQPGLEFQPALSPDGREVAYVEGPISRPRIVLRSAAALVDGGELRLSDGLDGYHWFPTWSPDGESLRFAVCRGKTGGCSTQQVGKLGGATAPVFAGGASAWIENRPHRVLELTPGRSAWSRDGTRVAYSVGMDSLYVSPASIASPRLLTILESPDAFWPHSLTWSPDGRWIAFVDRRLGGTIASGDEGVSSIWLADSEDGTQARITDDSSVNMSPQWLPDSRHLLFVSDKDGARGIYVVEVGPNGPRGEPRSVLSASDAHSISVSADGRRLAYSKLTSSQNIWAVPITEGHVVSLSDARRVTTGNQVVGLHSLWPDGRWLLFDSKRGGGNTNLYRVPIGGGTPEPLSAYPYNVYNPVVSPDGTEIAFYTPDAEEGVVQLRVMPVSGGVPTVLASFSGVTNAPDWSPDGLTVAFQTFGDEGALHSTVWTVSREAVGASWSDPRELNDLECFWPEWSPDGAKLSCWLFPESRIALLSAAGEVVDTLDTQVRHPPRTWQPEFSWDGHLLYFFGLDADGSEGLWSLPATGGEPTKVIAFNDPTVVVQDAFTVGPDAIYFTVTEDESDIWVADLEIVR